MRTKAALVGGMLLLAGACTAASTPIEAPQEPRHVLALTDGTELSVLLGVPAEREERDGRVALRMQDGLTLAVQEVASEDRGTPGGRTPRAVAMALAERLELGEREGFLAHHPCEVGERQGECLDGWMVRAEGERVSRRGVLLAVAHRVARRVGPRGAHRRRRRARPPGSRVAPHRRCVVRARTSLALALLLLGCAQSHDTADSGAARDAGPRDAGMDSGAPTIDAGPDAAVDDGGTDADSGIDAGPPCLDEDGDGFTAFACGGEDCDDADPSVSPVAGPCTGPTTATRCVSGAATEVECPTDAPLCDARTGVCAVTACGDGVRHEGEVCDDGNDYALDGCDVVAGCERGRCGDARNCYPEAPYCVPIVPLSPGDFPTARCHPGLEGGLPLGSRCERHDECASTYCDERNRRCSVACWAGDCAVPGPHRWCGAAIVFDYGWMPLSVRVCEFDCRTSEECAAGYVCGPVHVALAEGTYVGGSCRPPHGPIAFGQPCVWSSECATNLCLEGQCTSLCRVDADCGADLPRCAVHDFRVTSPGLSPRPSSWGEDPFPRVCRPSE